MNKKIMKAALSLMIAGTLLMGSGISVYAKSEESTEKTEVTTEQKTTSENATTEAPKETPSRKHPKKSPLWLDIFLIIIFGAVAVAYTLENVQLYDLRKQMADGKKVKPEVSDDSMYGEKDETEEEESDYDEEDE